MRIRKYLAVLAMIALLVPIATSCDMGNNRNSEGSPQMLSWSDEIWRVLTAGADGGYPESEDALRICPEIVSALKFGTDEQAGEMVAGIDLLMEQYYEYGYLPRPAYEGLEEGWVSAMDAPFLAVTAWLAYERFGDEIYRQYVEDLIPYLVATPEEHGFVLHLSDEAWWPLEYAWPDVTAETAWYVLNGSLFGMVSLQALAVVTQDERLMELCTKAVAGYQLLQGEFIYPNEQWTYYALNSVSGDKNPNRKDKLLIEMTCAQALYTMTGKQVYLDIYTQRQEQLKAVFPVYAIDYGDGTATVSLLRAAAPHPYTIDIYPTVLELLDENGNLVDTLYADTRYYTDNWILDSVSSTAVSYRMYSRYNYEPLSPYFLFEAPIQYIDEQDANTVPLNGVWSAGNDAQMLDDESIEIDPNLSEKLYGNTYFRVDGAGFAQTPETYWAFEVENCGTEEIPMGAVSV